MSISRRDFMKLFGVSVASLLLAHCKRVGVSDPTPPDYQPTCYKPPPTEMRPSTPTLDSFSGRQRLRLLWLRFDELAQLSISDSEKGSTLRGQLESDHRTALDELVAAGEITAAVADLVQEAYTAALYHVWRSNAPITCYVIAVPYYGTDSAAVLIQQAEILSHVSGDIDPLTLVKAKVALEHDLAFYALTDEDVRALYDLLIANGEPYPLFEEVDLELTPDARTAAQFIIDLLTGK